MAKQLHKAKQDKYDEFYTQIADIERELTHYTQHFEGKTILCNCDDPSVSAFFTYFAYNFNKLGIKRLITTCYKSQSIDLFSEHNSEQAIALIYEGQVDAEGRPDKSLAVTIPLKGDGDFRSEECVEFLKEADIVVTNPPFSLFREYIAQLVEYKKSFLVIGNVNAITYKELFPLIRDNKLWLGVSCFNRGMYFYVPKGFNYREGYKFDKERNGCPVARVSSVCWFTNLSHRRRTEELILTERYSPERYPKYDNYDAIEVGEVADIPSDYFGAMGVPITFLDKYNPNQFEIIGRMTTTGIDEYNFGYPYIKGQKVYARLLIRHRRS